MEELERVIDFYSNSYDNHVIVGDFNMEVEDPPLCSLMGGNNLNSLTNKQRSCFSS